MTTSAQIRLLLAVVCGTFLLTAIVVKQTFTPKVNLEQTGIILQSNLNGREAYVYNFINSKDKFNTLKQAGDNPETALNLIQDFTTNNRIWVYTFYNKHLKFWSGIKILPDNPSVYKEGPTFAKMANGYYEVIKKTEGKFAALFFIPVKNIYYYQNRYLHNDFDKNILQDDNIDIADFTDKQVYDVHSVNHAYLFSVKLKPGAINHRFYNFQLYLWLLGFITLCILINKTGNYIAAKGYTYLAFAFLATFTGLTAFTFLKFNLPDLKGFSLFKPALYSSGTLFPSLGHFCLYMLLVCWLAAFIYHYRLRIIKKPAGKTQAYIIAVFGSALLIPLAAALLRLYKGLFINSTINFDISNVFNLSGYSLMGVLLLCFSFMLFFMVNDIFLTIMRRLAIADSHKALIFSGFILTATIITTATNTFSLFYILIGLFTVVRAHSIWHNQGKLNVGHFLLLLALCAIISAIKLNYFEQIKETEISKGLIHKLEIADDTIANNSFKNIESKIISDTVAVNYFGENGRNDDYLRNYLQKKYFDGYLSKYSLKMYVFDGAGQPITSDKTYLLNVFKDLVTFSSMKISQYFYHDNTFGFQSYFAILPVRISDTILGTIVIALGAKPLSSNITFPELLVNGEIKADNNYKNYSYAYYVDGRLQSQSGPYPYKLMDAGFDAQLKKYHTKINNNTKTWYMLLPRYKHLIYRPDRRSIIVVSRSESPIVQVITSVSFFFLVFLIFSALVTFFTWLWNRVRIYSIQNKQIKWGLRINLDNIAYRTRIQFSVIATVVFTLLLIGIITFQSISLQYEAQQDEMIRNKLSGLASLFEDGLKKNFYSSTREGQVRFDTFADTYQADLTLFSKLGVPLLTTQPKIYEHQLLAKCMNSRAFIIMGKQHQSMLLNTEKLGELTYKAAYVPVKDAQQVTTAYLQLPYFANETDYNERTGTLLNAMINIYALVFIAVGLFAVLIARQITWPLQFIQQSIGRVIYGGKNEPIKWERNDEIGALVNEYNKMISALEVSAQRLAQSERETAWREMAKQVAHEIKNPLTPLKLGLQLLDKAWKDNDPKFNHKFERFSKSFVEQIDSLSSIASEFSAFAKMPDTKMERVDVFDIINQAVIIFKQMDNITITYSSGQPFYINADRDQLMRCFNNLLKNAIEAIPLDKPGIISVTYKTEPARILIMLTDNGNGIPDNLRQKIFVPNFTTKSSGTGLGLAFVKNSIENTGGKIWFETETGKGTTFFISCPAAV